MNHLVLPTLGVITLWGLAGCKDQMSPASPDSPSPSDMQGTQPSQPAAQTGTQEATAESNARPITVTSYGSLADWDLDGNGQIEKSEFDQRLITTRLFADWDGDNDGELTDLEFTTSLYKAWDVNGDEIVDVYEYKFGNGVWLADGTMYGTFSDWDADGNQELSLVEFKTQEDRLMESFDSDGNDELTDLEFRTGMYKAWDVNGDEIVDLYEFNRVTGGPESSASSGRQLPMVVGYGKFGQYDTNADAKVTLQEFRSALAKTSLFDDLNAVERANVKASDFRGKLFEFWDLDGDEKLDTDEFKHGAGVFFPKVDTYGNFFAWDKNKDGQLTKQEFVEYEGTQRITRDWDKNKDQAIASDDLSTVVYEAWDVNGDGQLDVEEWRWW